MVGRVRLRPSYELSQTINHFKCAHNFAHYQLPIQSPVQKPCSLSGAGFPFAAISDLTFAIHQLYLFTNPMTFITSAAYAGNGMLKDSIQLLRCVVECGAFEHKGPFVDS